jgi:cAMP-dependent protein kinase regulator
MSLPSTYLNELKSLEREILKSQPSDILQFCANFFNRRLEAQRAEYLLAVQHPTSGNNQNMAESTFPGLSGATINPFGANGGGSFGGAKGAAFGGSAMHKLEEEDENDTIASPTTPSFRQTTMGGDPSPSSDRTAPIPASMAPGVSTSLPSPFRPLASGSSEGFPSNYSMGRRTSVSAESLNPTSSLNDNWSPPFSPKTPDQLTRLKTAISGNFLFSHLTDEQASQVLGALVEKPIPTKDIKIITQGDVGDYFYVVEKGNFDIYVNPKGSFQPGPNGMGNKVTTIGPGGSFGELALMYNAPRAATVISTEAGSCLWALDRVTFRRILMENTFQRRKMYESFLGEVPLLSSLDLYERSKIADALETKTYTPGTTIIQEGDPGEAFFIMESGEADCFKRGKTAPITSYKKGDYFGELALLNDAPRAASVVAKTEVKVATLGKDGFQRLLGSVEDIMRRNDPSKQDNVDPLTK